MHHPTYHLLLTFVSQGCKYGGQEVWHRHSTDVPTFPAQDPSGCRGPDRFCYFASLYLILRTKTAGILCSQPQQEMILGIYRFLNSWKKQGGERV